MKHWSRQKGRPFPKTKFCRYHIDDLAKNVQMAWMDGEILFPPDIRSSDDGKRYLDQLFAFRGKKANKTDDAPDSLIGAYALAHERHYVKRGKNLLASMVSMVNENGYRF